MLNRFSEWIKNFSDGDSAMPTEDDDFVSTITALLVEAAMADGVLGVDERSRILNLLTDQLELRASDAQTLLDEAIAEHNARVEIHSLVRQIRTDTEIAIPISRNNCPTGRSSISTGTNTMTVVRADPKIGDHTCRAP